MLTKNKTMKVKIGDKLEVMFAGAKVYGTTVTKLSTDGIPYFAIQDNEGYTYPLGTEYKKLN